MKKAKIKDLNSQLIQDNSNASRSESFVNESVMCGLVKLAKRKHSTLKTAPTIDQELPKDFDLTELLKQTRIERL